MSTPIDDGGPAFPFDLQGVQPCQGMSLRDWFAGQALNGFCSDGSSLKATHDALESGKSLAQVLAKSAYDAADAMLAARNENK
jgi:hypothetical protein